MAAVLIATAATMRPEDATAPVRREINQQFRYAPKPAPGPGSPTAADQKIEKLEPVVVTAPGRPRDLESDLRWQAQALRERRFAPLNGGGAILERKGRKITSELQLKLISVRHGAGIDVLSLSW